jgi:hypothetical protein
MRQARIAEHIIGDLLGREARIEAIHAFGFVPGGEVVREGLQRILWFAQTVAKYLSSTQEPGFRSSRCNAHCIRSIHELELVPVIALHNQAEARRKFTHCLQHPVALLALCIDLFGIGHRV